MVLGRGKNIVGGSDGEAEAASFIFQRSFHVNLWCSRFSPLVHWSCLDCVTALVHLAAIKKNALANLLILIQSTMFQCNCVKLFFFLTTTKKLQYKLQSEGTHAAGLLQHLNPINDKIEVVEKNTQQTIFFFSF